MSSLLKQVDLHIDYAKDGLDKVIASDVHGFPIGSFAGLWYLTTNASDVAYTNGAAAAGPFFDGTGNGKHATILLGASPTKQTWGLQVTDADGLWLDTGIAFPASGTAIVAIENTVSPSVSHHMAWLRAGSVGTPAAKGDSVSGWAAPHPSCTTTAAVAYANTHGILDLDSSELGVQRLNIMPTRGPANGFNIVAFRWNDATGKIELFTMQGYVKATISAGFWSSYSGHAIFGLIPFGTIRPCTGIIAAAALATSAVSDEILTYAMYAMARAKSFTGSFTPFGYVKPTI